MLQHANIHKKIKSLSCLKNQWNANLLWRKINRTSYVLWIPRHTNEVKGQTVAEVVSYYNVDTFTFLSKPWDNAAISSTVNLKVPTWLADRNTDKDSQWKSCFETQHSVRQHGINLDDYRRHPRSEIWVHNSYETQHLSSSIAKICLASHPTAVVAN